MTKNSQDELARAYATLSSLRKNIDKMATYDIPEKYVNEFHSVLIRLQSIGIGVSEFWIPNSEVQPRITASFGDGTRSYTEEKYVDKPYLLTKIDAILSYFEIITSEKPKKMGFSTTED